ncbi:MAG TPA: Rpn family recombination-promoting nuclease/putative transposase, partial [Candidatus Deferrimicrobium sp.]|nr:Rpn family recombination-promoting nuclease/putative transposase [Candidatus Deferrimicrobium sp.]
MSSERKLVSFDWVMKQLLRNKADFVIFEGFLSELLHDDIKIKSLLESESNGDSKNDKTNRVDILVENSREELIIIEVQRETEYDYLQRILFGTSKLLLEYMQKGMPYSKIRKVISISLVYFDLGQGEDYAYYGKTEFIGLNKKDILELNSAQQELYKTEKIANIYPEYYILKINRFDDIARNTIDEWIYFFKNEKIKDNFTARGLKEAKEKLDILKLSDEERREYEEYLENLHYQASMYESSYKIGEMKGKKAGKEEGIEVGSKNKALEMAKKLKEKGIDIAVISETS